jgi:sirohydrochlorin cobaltochelatase
MRKKIQERLSFISVMIVCAVLLAATRIAVADTSQPVKKAILVCSFGTTYAETRKVTIEAIENRVRTEFPDWTVRRAFSAHKVIKVLKERDGIDVDTPEQAMQKLANDGFSTVVVLATDVVPGVEYEYKKRVFDEWEKKKTFKQMSISLPLLYYMGQEKKPDDITAALNAFKTQLPSKTKNNEAILILAHGTYHPANAYYTVIQDRIHKLGWKNTWIYTVEGTPTFEDALEQLKAKKIKSVTLYPFMLVAGDHAHNDMAGDDKESHKSQLIAAGIKVDAYIHGLGENVAIQNLYMQRLRDAIASLDKPAAPKNEE